MLCKYIYPTTRTDNAGAPLCPVDNCAGVLRRTPALYPNGTVLLCDMSGCGYRTQIVLRIVL